MAANPLFYSKMIVELRHETVLDDLAILPYSQDFLAA